MSMAGFHSDGLDWTVTWFCMYMLPMQMQRACIQTPCLDTSILRSYLTSFVLPSLQLFSFSSPSPTTTC